MKKYGLSSYKIEGQDSQTHDVYLGDGKTRIQTILFEDGSAGICIVDDGMHQNKPFTEVQAVDLPNNAVEFDSEKVILRADNVKSLSVLISRLSESIIMFDNDKFK